MFVCVYQAMGKAVQMKGEYFSVMLCKLICDALLFFFLGATKMNIFLLPFPIFPSSLMHTLFFIQSSPSFLSLCFLSLRVGRRGVKKSCRASEYGNKMIGEIWGFGKGRWSWREY